MANVYRHNRDLHLACLQQLLGNDPKAIVAVSGRSVTTTYLREVWWDTVWQFQHYGDLPTDVGFVDRLLQRRELIRQAEHLAGRPRPSREDGQGMCHSPDFRTVDWGREHFKFGARQAACICLMWKEFAQGTPFKSQDHILENAREAYEKTTGLAPDELVGLENCSRLRDVFKVGSSTVHEAWKTMIVKEGKNSFGICPPNHGNSHQIPT